MAAPNPTGAEPVTVSVPAACTERLRAEARELVAQSAQNVVEGADWHARHQDHVRFDVADLPRLRSADRIWGQVGESVVGEPVKVTGDRAIVGDLLRGCVRDVADDLREETEGEWSPRSVLSLAAELEAWAVLFRDSRLATAPDAGRAL